MTTKIAKASLLTLLFVFTSIFYGCEGIFDDEPDNETTEESLYVKFLNEGASQYTITTIQVRPRGSVTNPVDPTDNWGDNLLKDGLTLAPGAHTFLTLDIPAGHWSEYRLGVEDGSGNQIMLHEQTNYSGMTDLPITHWGGDTRTVSVTIVYDQYTDMIVVNGWSDFVGIEE